jgi:hypothetical protein
MPCVREVESCMKIVRTNEPEDHAHGKGEPLPGGIMHDGWCGKLIPHTASHNLARPSSDYVLDRFAIPPVGERNEESFWRSKNIQASGRPA